jgi:hypothetical protein
LQFKIHHPKYKKTKKTSKKEAAQFFETASFVWITQYIQAATEFIWLAAIE